MPSSALLATSPSAPVLATRRIRAMEIVRDHTALSLGAALIPVPLVDSVIVTGVQLQMLEHLARHYGVAADQKLSAHLATAASVGVGHHLLTQNGLAQTLKGAIGTVPVVGRVLRIFSWPALLAALTWKIGQMCVDHYESAGKSAALPLDSLLHNPLALLGRPDAHK